MTRGTIRTNPTLESWPQASFASKDEAAAAAAAAAAVKRLFAACTPGYFGEWPRCTKAPRGFYCPHYGMTVTGMLHMAL
jgi:hypothetical protein